MKKFIGLGLAGILALGSNLSAFEINEKGFPVPDKASFKLKNIFPFSYDSDNIGTVKEYKQINGYDVFFELGMNDMTWAYIILESEPDDELKEIAAATFLKDNNCDGIFETKYDLILKDEREDSDNARAIPVCYLKNSSNKK